MIVDVFILLIVAHVAMIGLPPLMGLFIIERPQRRDWAHGEIDTAHGRSQAA